MENCNNNYSEIISINSAFHNYKKFSHYSQLIILNDTNWNTLTNRTSLIGGIYGSLIRKDGDAIAHVYGGNGSKIDFVNKSKIDIYNSFLRGRKYSNIICLAPITTEEYLSLGAMLSLYRPSSTETKQEGISW